MDEILKVLNSDNKELTTLATAIIEADQEYRTGNLTKEEYTEILEDIQRGQLIEEGATDVALKGLLITGVAGLLQIL
jgi:hypothetical protein